MLTHLDDPSPPEPSAGALGAVLSRAARLRRRRTNAVLATVAAGTMALGVVVGGLYVPRASSAQAEIAFSSQFGLLARGTLVPPSDLADVVFLSPDRGFAMAVHGSDTLLASSDDGGNTWRVVDPSLPTGFPAQLEFPDRSHGYLWGGAPTSSGSVPLWVSSDGGRSWSQAPIGPVVSDVSAIESGVWAVVGTCPVSPAGSAPSCPVVVEVSTNGGSRWSPTASTPPVEENSSLSISDQDIELARISAQRAYVLAFGPDGQGGPASGRIAFTSDGGRSWASRPDPCPPSFSFGQQLAASSTADLWLTCASQGSAGAQAKALYRSDDGGRAWLLAAAANAPVLSSNVTLDGAGGFPVGGYVTPYSLGHENLAVVSSADAWLYPDRSAVFETTDGGRTWRLAPGLARAGLVAGASGNVVFADATHGWVCETGVGL